MSIKKAFFEREFEGKFGKAITANEDSQVQKSNVAHYTVILLTLTKVVSLFKVQRNKKNLLQLRKKSLRVRFF